jgi:asparagine N-glycosylation enzyme membrane subunit Stt3
VIWRQIFRRNSVALVAVFWLITSQLSTIFLRDLADLALALWLMSLVVAFFLGPFSKVLTWQSALIIIISLIFTCFIGSAIRLEGASFTSVLDSTDFTNNVGVGCLCMTLIIASGALGSKFWGPV